MLQCALALCMCTQHLHETCAVYKRFWGMNNGGKWNIVVISNNMAQFGVTIGLFLSNLSYSMCVNNKYW